MILTINDNIRLWEEFNPIDLSLNEMHSSLGDERLAPARLGFQKTRIAIRDRWFDVLSPSELVRKRSSDDGYYRVVYIQINMENGEYYIGKANRPRWSELTRYQGSGLKFREKFRKHKEKFARYYIADCETAEETEELESSLVDRVILADPKCLNLVAGGSGTTRHPSIAETSAKKREHMLNNPEQYEPMLAAAKKAFQSGSTPALRARSERIREVMGAEKYREMMSKRIKNWKEEKPEAYAEARRKSRAAIRSTEVQEKRVASLKKWVQKNPEKHKTWEENRIRALASEESKAKRKASLKAWREKNPEQARDNARRRGQASAAKNRKAVCMIDLQTGRVLKEFPSQRAAAQWLVENGKAKNMNCVSSISSVCLRKPCSTGYGHRKKAYGYDWRFKSDIADAD